MKKLILTISICLFVICNFYCQDIIIKNDSNRIECKIIKEDSLNVYFTTIIREKEISTYLGKNDIQRIIYEKDNASLILHSDSIISEKKGIGYNYYLNGRKLNISELDDILKINDLAYEKFKSAKGISVIANIFAGAGGFCIGYPIGYALGGGKANWALAGIGAGLIVIAIPILSSAEKKAREAVDIYNKGIRKTSMSNKELKLEFTNNGIGLCLRF